MFSFYKECEWLENMLGVLPLWYVIFTSLVTSKPTQVGRRVAWTALSVYFHTHACMHAHKHACKHVHTHTHMCTRIHTHVHTHTCTHTCTHTHVRACTCSHFYTQFIHTHTHTHTHTHMHTHTYTHTCASMYMLTFLYTIYPPPTDFLKWCF